MHFTNKILIAAIMILALEGRAELCTKGGWIFERADYPNCWEALKHYPPTMVSGRPEKYICPPIYFSKNFDVDRNQLPVNMDKQCRRESRKKWKSGDLGIVEWLTDESRITELNKFIETYKKNCGAEARALGCQDIREDIRYFNRICTSVLHKDSSINCDSTKI